MHTRDDLNQSGEVFQLLGWTILPLVLHSCNLILASPISLGPHGIVGFSTAISFDVSPKKVYETYSCTDAQYYAVIHTVA